MGFSSFSVRPLFGAAIFSGVAACGGTSSSHGGGDGMAGMSGSGASGGAAGTSGHAGSGAQGGSGGAGAAGGSGGSAGSAAGAGAGAGGSGAFSGGAGAGMGGTGGTTECVLGGLCSEGSTCTQAVCCPCTLKCSNGAWAQDECVVCGQIGCPDTPPNNGDACDLCAVPPSCSWDERPVDGPLYTAECVNDRWEVKMQWGDCCTTDGDCGTGVCVKSACKPASNSQCWNDEQCSAGYVCSGAVVCECGQLCGAPDQAGACVPDDQDCCISDTDCGDTGECVQGVCKPRPPEFPQCWTTRDCVGGVCVAPSVCPCGSDCLVPDAPGNCAFP